MEAFAHPRMPVLLGGMTAEAAIWGLVPSWARTEEQVKTTQTKTLNCKSETMFQLPSFRGSTPGKRCLVPVNDFFEYQHQGKLKVPHLLRIEGKGSYFLAGLWSEFSGGKTFTIVPCRPTN